MAGRRPFGVLVIAAVFVFLGGWSMVVLVFAMIDSVRFFGLPSLAIPNLPAALGFLLFGVVPVVFYATGMGLFLRRPWARSAVLFVIPAALFLLLLHFAARMAATASWAGAGRPVPPEIFLQFFLRYLALVLPLTYYFTRRGVKSYFMRD